MPRPSRSLFASSGRRLAAGLALLVTVGVMAAVVLSSSPPPGSKNSPGKTSGTATVQRRDLVATDTESGTLSYSDPETVYNRLSGTITWLPRVGQVIKPGQTLFKVGGSPVLLMRGATPAYRSLGASDGDGADVEQLNRNLVNLGFNADGIVVDDQWQPATTVGVELLQESLGESVTGSLSLGRVVFMTGAQLVSALDANVGSAGSGGGGSGTGGAPATGAATEAATAAPQFASLRRPASPSTPAPDPTAKTLSALTALLKAESAQLKAQAAQLKAERNAGTRAANKPSGGSSPSASATAILQTSSTQLVVTVDLSASSQSEARVGAPVRVELPAGKFVHGRITAVSPVAQNTSGSGSGSSSSGGSGGAGASGGASGSSSAVPVTIRLRGHHTGAGLDQAAVSVNFARARARHVLSAPVTALLATSGSTYAVQEASAPYKLIPVTTGLIAAGYVQISGAGIHAGLNVTDSQG